jgi:N-methylhydantoinase A
MTVAEQQAAAADQGTADAYVGVDVGGTHTDVTVIVGDRVERGKALTTYDEFSRGVLEATAVAAGNLDMTLEELLARTHLFVNGTTVVTNAITELRGSRVGVLVTAGFRDTFRMAGGPRFSELDDHLQTNVPDIVERNAIIEIEERIDHAGRVLVALNVQAVVSAVDRLVDEQGVDAIAICFLSSFVNPQHELEAETEIRRRHPDLFITPSHRVFPVRGENRRWTTAVLNSFVQDRAEEYLDSLSTRLWEAGLRGNLAFFQGVGGGISAEKAKEYPLALLGSGPAGGAIGALALARRMGHDQVLLGDMGGTSFDTGIIHGDEVRIATNLEIGQLKTGVNLVDVVSVGAGGGSIAWVGERGVPQVGPQSARSTPGPACLGRGGTEPTVTDAMVAMGFIDPARYLDGRVTLKPELAREALDRVLGERFGWSTLEAAAAVHDLVVVNMATAMREISVEKGHDPRQFVFLAYGGTLPLFAAQIAESLDITDIVIPRNSSVFCAQGVLAADYVLRGSRTLDWNLADGTGVDRVNAATTQLAAELVEAMRAQGFADTEIEVQRSGDFRFMGQSYQLPMSLPDRDLVPEDGAELGARFLALYEQTYGVGTAWRGVPETMVACTVSVVGRQPHPEVRPSTAEPASAAAMLIGEREIYIPGERAMRTVPVYDDRRFTPGTATTGPAIVDAADTTIYVPADVTIRRDEWSNYVLTRGASR